MRNTLDLPGATNRAYSKVPTAAMQGQKPWSQFDGSVGDPVLRSMIAVYTSGASIAGLAEPQIADNVRKAATYTLTLGEKPALPTLAQAFPDRPKPAAKSLARGKTVYDAHCASCMAARPMRAGSCPSRTSSSRRLPMSGLTWRACGSATTTCCRRRW